MNSAPIGQGRERKCYVHPDDPGKAIKVSGGDTSIQSQREIELYRSLMKRKRVEYTHLPRYYGQAETNLGTGIVVDLVRDFDGEVSKSLRYYLDEGASLESFEPLLTELKDYLLRNLVIFNHDLVPRNLLLQKVSADRRRLVMIDGIGDVVWIRWFNRFAWHARSKIDRRWRRFMRRLYAKRGGVGEPSADS